MRQTKHDNNEITNTQQGTTRKKRAFTNNTSAMGFISYPDEVYSIQHYVNKRPLATSPPTPRLYGKIKFWNYCKLEGQVSLYHSPDLNNSERGPPKDHFEGEKKGSNSG